MSKLKGAIFFSGQYGSTAQYAQWIAEATGLPVYDTRTVHVAPGQFDFLVLGSSVIIYKLTIRKWLRRYLENIQNKPLVLFTVSGAPAGPKLDRWVANSLPASLQRKISHFALQGRLNFDDLQWWVKLTLRIGAWMNSDQRAKEEEMHGFDFMDKASIEPVVRQILAIQAGA